MRGRCFQLLRCGIALCTTFAAAGLKAEDVYLEPAMFVREAFPGTTPQEDFVWLKGAVRDAVAEALGHRYPQLRVKYWEAGGRTAWILEEIGKVKPITAGYIVEGDTLQSFQVLIYRESHGWEIRYPFFTRQFEGAERAETGGLETEIDGISGATLSVDAVTRLAEVALILHRAAMEKKAA